MFGIDVDYVACPQILIFPPAPPRLFEHLYFGWVAWLVEAVEAARHSQRVNAQSDT